MRVKGTTKRVIKTNIPETMVDMASAQVSLLLNLKLIKEAMKSIWNDDITKIMPWL